MPKSLDELRSCGTIVSSKRKRNQHGPTRFWKVTYGKAKGTICSYTVKHPDVIQRARERAFKHSQQFEEHTRSHAEIFIAAEINPV